MSDATKASDRMLRVRTKALVKTFGSTVALRGVDVAFEAGRITLIEGSNGSGKSTLLGIIGTVVRPSGGSVQYEFGTGIRTADEVRGHVGWLSHETLAYGDLTGRQNIEMAARFHGFDAKAIWSEVQTRFQLGAFAERPLRTNSRGQRQRVALAKALLHEPDLVLLDEPTTGLDQEGLRRLRSVVEEERCRGAIVVVVAHDGQAFGTEHIERVQLDRGRVA